jgi:hypothetical protein
MPSTISQIQAEILVSAQVGRSDALLVTRIERSRSQKDPPSFSFSNILSGAEDHMVERHVLFSVEYLWR